MLWFKVMVSRYDPCPFELSVDDLGREALVKTFGKLYHLISFSLLLIYHLFYWRTFLQGQEESLCSFYGSIVSRTIGCIMWPLCCLSQIFLPQSL